MLVDSHCHLDFPDFEADLDSIIRRARNAGVDSMLTICTHVSKFDQVRKIAETYDNVFCTVGIHPHNAEAEPDVTPEELVTLADHPKVIGFGETGLDLYYEHSPLEVQERQFRSHISAAREAKLPIIVHTREADEQTLRILTEEFEKGPFTGLIHCFSAGPELAEKVVEIGFYISVSGIITFKAADELRDTISKVPLDRILVETDAPFLAPIPMRGKRNEPAFTAHTAAKVAEVLGISQAAVAKATTENFFNLFDKSRRF